MTERYDTEFQNVKEFPIYLLQTTNKEPPICIREVEFVFNMTLK